MEQKERREPESAPQTAPRRGRNILVEKESWNDPALMSLSEQIRHKQQGERKQEGEGGRRKKTELHENQREDVVVQLHQQPHLRQLT